MRIFALFALMILAASAARAGGTVVPAPEIDAVAGLAAMGLVGSIVAIVWERRRR